MRHGIQANEGTRSTPYYFFGIGGNYTSSVAFAVSATNVGMLLVALALDRENRIVTARGGVTVAAVWASLYVLSLLALGVLTRARPKDLPRYVAMLATFQVATCIGRLRGSIDYGLILL
jgi:hypothetical protein